MNFYIVKYNNFYNFNESKIKKNIFENMPNNSVICIKDTINKLLYDVFNNTLYNESFSLIFNNKSFIIDCSKDWKTKPKRIISVNRELNNYICSNQLFNASKKCPDGCYHIYNDSSSLGDYYNCYNNPEGYYLINEYYKKCYESCKTCIGKGDHINHNCLQCNDNFTFEINKNNIKNCYQKCNHYYYFDNDYNYHCTNDFFCPKELNILVMNI